jgi:predicted TIM-barrel fold metal-dependent hydrolase
MPGLFHKTRLNRNGNRGFLPIPTRITGADEIPPLPQAENQRRTERAILKFAEHYSSNVGMDRRDFLKTACGMASAFMAMNAVYGPIFNVDPAEAANPDVTAGRRNSLSRQFIFDVQTHFVRGKYEWKGLLQLRKVAQRWNPKLKGETLTAEKIQYDNFVREVFLESDTTLALLSSAPSDDPEGWFIRNDDIARTRKLFNEKTGSKRLFSHAVITPGQPRWLDELDLAISEYKPDSWKGYTVGSPSTFSKYPWRLDDEKLVYPAYEKMEKAGIMNVCIHKGLISPEAKKLSSSTWRYGNVDDVGRAAKDWPHLNFIIYHSALERIGEPNRHDLDTFEKTGHIPWVSDLARIPEQYSVANVFAELGTVFATTVISNPRYCSGILGTLIKGLGVDHVLWGTDSVWYGSPQWQIEAFRRIEIPKDLQKNFGFLSLGSADGMVRKAILGLNAARLYRLNAEKLVEGPGDTIRMLKEKV